MEQELGRLGLSRARLTRDHQRLVGARRHHPLVRSRRHPVHMGLRPAAAAAVGVGTVGTVVAARGGSGGAGQELEVAFELLLRV